MPLSIGRPGLPAENLTPAEYARLYALKPEEAVAYLQGRKLITPTFDWRDMWHEEHAEQFTISRLARLDLLEAVRDGITRSVAGDLSRRDWTRDIKALLQKEGWWGEKAMVDTQTGKMVTTTFDPARLKLIYDTNANMAYSAGLWQRIERNRVTSPYIRYITKRDEKVRITHRAWDNLTLPVEHPIWNTHFPPNGWRCFVADTPIRCMAMAGLKSWYAGEMVNARTALGHDLTVTANHPILTGRGWMAAHELQEGDEVIGALGQVDAALHGVVDHEQPPTRAEDLFESLAAQGLRVVPMAPDDFHGDALRRKPEIHIACSDRALVDMIQAALIEDGGQLGFDLTLAGVVKTADESVCSPLAMPVPGDAMLAQDTADGGVLKADLRRDGPLASQPGSVHGQDLALGVGVSGVGSPPGAGKLSFDASGRYLDGLPFEALGIGSSAQRYPGQGQRAAQSGPADAALTGQLLEANAGLITLDKIVQIRKYQWAGHVYDFVTSTGLIMAGGVIASNCRCRAMSMGQRDYDAWKAQGRIKTEAPPEELKRWVDKRTGEVRQVPIGIDPGFDYNPGKATLASKGQMLLGKAIDAEPRTAAVAVREALANPRLLASLSEDFGQFAGRWIDEVKAAEAARAAGGEHPIKTTGELRHVGALSLETWMALWRRDLAPESAIVSVRDVDVVHAFRTGKADTLPQEWYARLPEHLLHPDAVLLDTTHPDGPAVLMLFAQTGSSIKLVVRVDYRVKGVGKLNLVETGKLITELDSIKAQLGHGYDLLEGSL